MKTGQNVFDYITENDFVLDSKKGFVKGIANSALGKMIGLLNARVDAVNNGRDPDDPNAAPVPEGGGIDGVPDDRTGDEKRELDERFAGYDKQLTNWEMLTAWNTVYDEAKSVMTTELSPTRWDTIMTLEQMLVFMINNSTPQEPTDADIKGIMRRTNCSPAEAYTVAQNDQLGWIERRAANRQGILDIQTELDIVADKNGKRSVERALKAIGAIPHYGLFISAAHGMLNPPSIRFGKESGGGAIAAKERWGKYNPEAKGLVVVMVGDVHKLLALGDLFVEEHEAELSGSPFPLPDLRPMDADRLARLSTSDSEEVIDQKIVEFRKRSTAPAAGAIDLNALVTKIAGAKLEAMIERKLAEMLGATQSPMDNITGLKDDIPKAG